MTNERLKALAKTEELLDIIYKFRPFIADNVNALMLSRLCFVQSNILKEHVFVKVTNREAVQEAIVEFWHNIGVARREYNFSAAEDVVLYHIQFFLYNLILKARDE